MKHPGIADMHKDRIRPAPLPGAGEIGRHGAVGIEVADRAYLFEAAVPVARIGPERQIRGCGQFRQDTAGVMGNVGLGVWNGRHPMHLGFAAHPPALGTVATMRRNASCEQDNDRVGARPEPVITPTPA